MMRTRFTPHAAMLAGVLLAAALSAGAQDGATYSVLALKPAVALELANATQAACRARDYQVTVAVVDRAGLPQVALRDQLAGNFTWTVALAKARTAAGFRQPTLGLARAMGDRPELGVLHQVDDVMMVGGGVPIEAAGVVIGALGVSGAPTPEADHACAEAGLESIAEQLLF
ncbi:MAG: heme-binding protein [Gammaproteobacteria bacterium]